MVGANHCWGWYLHVWLTLVLMWYMLHLYFICKDFRCCMWHGQTHELIYEPSRENGCRVKRVSSGCRRAQSVHCVSTCGYLCHSRRSPCVFGSYDIRMATLQLDSFIVSNNLRTDCFLHRQIVMRNFKYLFTFDLNMTCNIDVTFSNCICALHIFSSKQSLLIVASRFPILLPPCAVI